MTAISSTLLAALVLLIGSGVWIWVALYAVGIIGLYLFRDMPIENLISQVTYKIVTTPELMALTLFVLWPRSCFAAGCRSRFSKACRPGRYCCRAAYST